MKANEIILLALSNKSLANVPQTAALKAEILRECKKLIAVEITKQAVGITPENICNELHYLPDVPLKKIEIEYIKKALHYFGYDKGMAAKALCMNLKTLRKRLHDNGEGEYFKVKSGPKKERK